MNIAICDDNRYDLMEIHKMILEYRQYSKIKEVHQYEDAKLLLGAIEEGRQLDVIIMDIILPEKSGIDVVRDLQTVSPRSQIIFVSI